MRCYASVLGFEFSALLDHENIVGIFNIVYTNTQLNSGERDKANASTFFSLVYFALLNPCFFDAMLNKNKIEDTPYFQP